jgi:hypothetical protein
MDKGQNWDIQYTKRQASQHVCLPSFLGDGDKWIEIVFGDVFFILGRLEQPRQDKNFLYRHDKPN